MLRPELDDGRDVDGRVDVDGNYVTFPTSTGTLPQCRLCGALVGDKPDHDAHHDGEARRVIRGIRTLFRLEGRRSPL